MPMPSLKRWTITTDRDDQPQPAADRQAGRQRHAVEEAVQAHAHGADEADVAWRLVAVVELGGRLVPDVERW